MKLQPAMIFQEHMVLQQGKPLPIWGTSANDDQITVCLNGLCKTATAQNGEWSVTFDPLEAMSQTSLSFHSAKTDETIILKDVAVGEVILAGGQSNMEFLMKYDYDFEQTKKLPGDHDLRYFCYPQTAYTGFLEKEPVADWGYWRTFEESEDRGMFSAVGAYAGLRLRQNLNVPVGIISCNWGGTPATAWIAMEDILANPKLKPVLDFHEKAVENTHWSSYIQSAFEKLPAPTPQMKAFTDRFMMGEDMSEFFKAGPPPMNPDLYNAYMPGPLSCIRPAGLYDLMLSKVAPYPIRSIIWWQGEDDDARDWVDFYDESMATLIQSWRKLWKEEIPFFQVELAPFRGVGVTGAKHYDVLRHKQYEATRRLKEAYDVCILDAGEEFNIHPRHKQIVGYRVGGMLLQHVYHQDVLADCPIVKEVRRQGAQIEITFDYTYGTLVMNDKLKTYLQVTAKGKAVDYQAHIDGDVLVLTGDFSETVQIAYCESNYCEAALFNSEGQPVFGFTKEV